LAVFGTVALVFVQGIADEVPALQTNGAGAVRTRAVPVVILDTLVGPNQSVAAEVIEALVGAAESITGNGHTTDLANVASIQVLLAVEMATSVHLHAGKRDLADAAGLEALVEGVCLVACVLEISVCLVTVRHIAGSQILGIQTMVSQSI